MDEKKRGHDLEEAKDLIDGHVITDSQRFSVNEILSEYRYDSALSGRSRRKPPEEPVSLETQAFKELAEKMKAIAQAQPAPEPPHHEPRHHEATHREAAHHEAAHHEAPSRAAKPKTSRLEETPPAPQKPARRPKPAKFEDLEAPYRPPEALAPGDPYPPEETPPHSRAKRRKKREPRPEPPADERLMAEIQSMGVDWGTDLGQPGVFDKAFAPSDSFVRPHPADAGADMEEEEEHPFYPDEGEKQGDSLLTLLRRRARRREPQGPVLAVDKAAARLTVYLRFFTLRLGLTVGLCFFLTLITFAHRLGLSMPPALTLWQQPTLYLLIQMIFLTLAMACAIDVLSKGLSDLAHFRPGMESAVLLSCLASILHVVSILVSYHYGSQDPQNPPILPYCAVSALSVLCAMWSQRTRYEACRRAYQTAALTGQPFTVQREESLWEGGALVKTRGSLENFVAQTEQDDGAARFAHFLVPLGALAALLFALIASVGQDRPGRFFWAFAALMSVVAPFCAAFCYPLPFRKVVKRLSLSGSALAGWAGARAFYQPVSVILTDGDLFPPGTVTLNGLKVFGSFGFDKMISYAASLTAASHSGLASAFDDLLRGQSDTLRQVNSFRHYEGGGLGGEIGGDSVLLGNSAFMLRMGIRLPQGIKLQNILFISVNLDLVGVFAINYTPTSHVRVALSMLLRHDITPVFATRDVNLTPLSVGKRFRLKLDAAEYPPIEQRLELSDPREDSLTRPVAVVARDGLYPYAEAVVAGRRLGQVTRVNLAVYLLCALLGLVLMAFLTFKGEAAIASPCNVILYLALWTLPTFLISGWAHRY
ncbi:MAG: hypothetical protein LBT60_02870 [Oscillospiraceae bacterium]|jgi:hypothetical protein|nr:hypothetical protein [Oscillospiraceae bacterium]